MGCFGCLGNAAVFIPLFFILGLGIFNENTRETFLDRREECNFVSNDTFGSPALVGPGFNRSAIAYITSDVPYPVTGQAIVDGRTWYQLDGRDLDGEAFVGWVTGGEDGGIVGDCSNVPNVAPPPIIPAPPPDSDGDGILDDVDLCPGQGDAGYGLNENGCPLPPPEEPAAEGPGEWLPCGSCGPCDDGQGTLHASSECVTSPDGQCLWDPATCVPEGHESSGDEPLPPPPDDGDIIYD